MAAADGIYGEILSTINCVLKHNILIMAIMCKRSGRVENTNNEDKI